MRSKQHLEDERKVRLWWGKGHLRTSGGWQMPRLQPVENTWSTEIPVFLLGGGSRACSGFSLGGGLTETEEKLRIQNRVQGLGLAEGWRLDRWVCGLARK